MPAPHRKSDSLVTIRLAGLLPALLIAASVYAQTGGVFTLTGNMTTPRNGHTATLLMDGKVLIAGGGVPGPGGGQVLASAELYDPATGRFTPTGDMTTPRRLHTATLLPDGRVLIAGGYSAPNSALASTELYDPSTGVFTPTGDMIEPQGWDTAILLPSGKVLIVGGYQPGNYPNLVNAELYDPDTGTFALTGGYAAPAGCDFCAPSILLADGRVLFPGQSKLPQIYNPASDTFIVTGPMTSYCGNSAASLLMNGKVLLSGGEDCGRSFYADLYDPTTGSFASTGNMRWRRVWHSLTLLPDGTVLAAGGETDSCSGNLCYFAGSVMSAELYNPTAGTWEPTGDMTGPRSTQTATLLNDGTVLIAGGVSYGGIGIFFGGAASAEVYTPTVLIPPPGLLSVSGDGQGQGFIWRNATGQLVSPENPAEAGETVQIYCVGLTDGSVIPPQISIGGHMAEIESFGNAPGWTGVNQLTVRVPSGATGSAVPVRLTYLGRTSNEVTVVIQ